MKSKQQTSRIGLYLDTKTWHYYDADGRRRFHLKLQFVRNEGWTKDGSYDIRNPDRDDPRQACFDELDVEGRITTKQDGSRELYGLEVLYGEPAFVDLRRARYMAKMLKKVAKGLDAHPIQPKSFGQYCALIAQILHCHGIVVRTDDTLASDYRDRTHSVYVTSQIQSVVDHEVEQFVGSKLAASRA